MEERSWMEHVGRAAESLLDTAYALLSALPCGAGGTHVELNGRTYEVVKLLGEGGFSLVYLVRDPASGQQYALKKIRCQYGEASVRDALAEVDAMNRFRGPNVIRACDTAVVRDDARASVLGNVPTHDEESGQGRVVYILLPYYANGNLQDAINAHVIHATHFDERTLLHLFLGACRGVQTMHHYVPSHTGGERAATAAPQGESAALLFDAESDAAYPPAPPMRAPDAPDAVDAAAREAYAHRDIKPAYVALLTQQHYDCRRPAHRGADGLWQHAQGQNTHPVAQGGRCAPGLGRGAFKHALPCP
ncbi:non-specific serine/threonine protein kinase [Malassezia furfur]|uniref:non-specific serine/threonine protein kinase n=1 Tax=Malassezia furfur TaxID=55194 RepID=A0ABY8ELV5_MALFU|nr:non-specific serine/threonine protein kinase [Malassezia furfur]